MSKRQSPYPEKTSLKRLQLLKQQLLKKGRELRIYAGQRNGHVMLIENGTMMGPFPNWKARWVMEQMLAWHEKHQAVYDSAREHVKRVVASGLLFTIAS